jgi:hypothetical protein
VGGGWLACPDRTSTSYESSAAAGRGLPGHVAMVYALIVLQGGTRARPLPKVMEG